MSRRKPEPDAAESRRGRPVRKALIPAAGLGTRMRPWTLSLPKEMASLGSRPAIHWVIEEAAAAGIETAGLVLRPGKEILVDYLLRAQEAGELPSLGLEILYQQEPTGLGDAILLASDFTGNEPFAILLPDNLPLSPDYRLQPLLRLAETEGREALGVIRVDSSQAGLYGDSGVIDCRSAPDGTLEITRLRDKRPGRLRPRPGRPVLRACGRLVCQPSFHRHLEEARPAGAEDYDEVAALQRVIRERGAAGLLLPPPLFDLGHPDGLLAAAAFLWRRESEADCGPAGGNGPDGPAGGSANSPARGSTKGSARSD
jgi:UTP--glucose-1-phosphate uridylyltransferase